jgi:hypothetical protein
MDYQTIYNKLINRALIRESNPVEYYESHHIVPRCLGGKDNKDNLVNLTAREHFIAHLCLVKIHPGNGSLVRAAVMMACGGSVHHRSGNRIYEWLRKKHSVAMSQSQTGAGNSQFGSTWVFNKNSKENKKVKISELSNWIKQGWEQGRVYDFNDIYYTCVACGIKFRNLWERQTCSDKCKKVLLDKQKFQVFAGREEELKKHYASTKSMNKALKAMGLPGAISHYYYWAKSVLNH